MSKKMVTYCPFEEVDLSSCHSKAIAFVMAFISLLKCSIDYV